MKKDFVYPAADAAADSLIDDALDLLKELITKPSMSGHEELTAGIIESFLQDRQIFTLRKFNNIWCYNLHFDHLKPTILLNSHHDTVKPSAAYTKNPFEAIVQEGKLFGLGSNDAGASVVSLMAAFLYFFQEEKPAF